MKLDDIKDPYAGLNQAGVYEAIVEDIEVRKTKGTDGKSEKLMLVPTLTVVSPSEALGTSKSDYYVIGTDEDSRRKLAEDLLGAKDETWAAKAGSLKELAGACGWPGDKEIVFQPYEAFPKIPVALLQFCKGKKVWFTVKQEREDLKDRNGQPNPRAGQVNGRIGKYFKVGTVGIKVGISEVQMQPIDYTGSAAPASQPQGTMAYPGAVPSAE